MVISVAHLDDEDRSLVLGVVFEESLAPDTDSGETFVSDFNYVVDRFGINSDTVAFDPEILTGQEWSTRTGQNTHSRLVEAATE